MGSSLEGDNTISAGSRYENTSEEIAALYMTQDIYNKYKSKIGAFSAAYACDGEVVIVEEVVTE